MSVALRSAGRLVQASGTAIVLPLLMTTFMELVPPAARRRVMSTVSLVTSAAPAIGPTVSDRVRPDPAVPAVALRLHPRLPMALAILVVGLRQVPNLNEPVTVR